MPMDTALYDIPLAQGFALMAFHQEANPWGRLIPVTDAYVSQEAWAIRTRRQP